jgi:AraC-like DNA-binding protein
VYREIAPPPDLAEHVACVWTSVSRGGVIFPDGCVDIVWRGDSLVVAGPATRPLAAGVPAGMPVFGVRFRVGAAGAALGLPADELLDEGSVPLAELWGPECEERVAAGGVEALVQVVREHLVTPLDRLARAAALDLAQPGARVGDLALALGLSERQLRRRFLDAVGYGPKTLARVLRFQRFLALARRGDDLASLAFAAGYADQAHLTRECRRLSGRTPAELVASGAVAAGERLPHGFPSELRR